MRVSKKKQKKQFRIPLPGFRAYKVWVMLQEVLQEAL